MRTGRRFLALFLLWLVPLLARSAAGAADDEFAAKREAMVQTIEHIASLEHGGAVPEVIDPRVLEAMRTVPRHALVPDDVRENAYEDRPLPIGYGQTISQPYIVALMTDLLDLEPGERALEVGTGSGYQAAVLGQLIDEVYTIEIVPPLAERAAANLAALGYGDVTVRTGDGYYGWSEHAPFDAIVVTAAATHIPPPLVEQLKPGGRLIVPVGAAFNVQNLMLVEKDSAGQVSTQALLPVAFVPLTRAPE